MGKPLPSLSKQVLTSLLPERRPSQAAQAVTGTISSSSAAVEAKKNAVDGKPPVFKLDLRPHAGALIAGAGNAASAAFARQLYRSGYWQRSLAGPAPDREYHAIHLLRNQQRICRHQNWRRIDDHEVEPRSQFGQNHTYSVASQCLPSCQAELPCS